MNMHAALAAVIPGATPLWSFDSEVWLTFRHGGKDYCLMDDWNFGTQMPEDSPARFRLLQTFIYLADLGATPADVKPLEEDVTPDVELGAFPNPEAALRSLLG